MTIVASVGRVLLESFRYWRATRRLSLLLVLALGLIVALLTVVAQFVAPLALYPFA